MATSDYQPFLTTLRALAFLSLVLGLFGLPAAGQSQTMTANDEIQILIDVSGSMKQNDPRNLRVDANKLLIGLLPDGSKASLWLFAEKPELLLKTEQVNPAWREQAIKVSDKIHSRGIYTHIEAAIQNALEQGFSGNGKRHLVLLTDGVVDIDKDIMVSADSRERILSEWIPKLQAKKIQVQTVALSEQADKELLESLALETGGWSELAESAEQLQRIFLKMAQKSSPRETLPLQDNRFNVDASIKEFSAVVFKKPQATPTQLLAPNGKAIDKHSQSVAWLESAGYDLITVKQPPAGDWRIAAAFDPDNQVMILTDLNLQIEELPNFIADKQPLPVKAHFTEQGKLINRHDFLSLVSISLSMDHQPPVPLAAITGEPGFFQQILADLPRGRHSLTLIADGKTFKRELVREIEVVESPITVEQIIDRNTREVTLRLIPDIAMIDTSSLAIQASVQQSGKDPIEQTVSEHDGQWSLKLPAVAPGDSLQVRFDVMAKSLDGKALSPSLAPLQINDNSFLTAPQETDAGDEHKSAESHGEATANDESASDETATQHEDSSHQASETSWLLIAGIVLVVNLIVISAGIFTYRLIKKATAKKQQQLLERLA